MRWVELVSASSATERYTPVPIRVTPMASRAKSAARHTMTTRRSPVPPEWVFMGTPPYKDSVKRLTPPGPAP